MALSASKEARFRQTHWSLILAASDLNNPGVKEALGALYQDYWRPIYAFLRRRGYSPEDSQDLLQEFFRYLIEKNPFKSADREKGRFRSFLLGVLVHFLSNVAKIAHAEKRGGSCTFVSLDTDEAEYSYLAEAADRWTPEMIFERRWALTILQKAMEELKREYDRAHKSVLFQALHASLSEQASAPPQVALATELGMSEGALRVASHRMRRRYGEMIRQRIVETVADPAEVDEEVRHLKAVLSA